ncbi:Ig-like domain-containing protein [Pseudomonas sp. rhizo66]|uniref:Ig-like domain-containing protein n=1 Tax=Pseudomonas sp. rhizo66 TaxID=3059674 RepID=UPI00288DED31|nr:Ig-like domain-containing protein [Pseudomonas sp. rhizo66]MDT3312100.1 Ig-like domain-containing protein [Pseudomonas sp. rhizo66]
MRKKTNAPLKPSVDGAPGDVLDPANIPAKGVTVRIKPYDDMAYRDHVYLFVGEDYTDDIPIGSTAVGKDVTFTVLGSDLVVDANDIVPIHYEVQFHDGDRAPSQTLNLLLQSGFDAQATLDLSAHNYVVSVDKPPVKLPAAARMTRLAQWGSGPYQYTSSDPAIASVDEQTGEVTALRNGDCDISATDSQSQTRTYPLTVKGIVEVHFLTDSADWQGMLRLCETAKLQPVTLSQIKRMWTLYFPDAGPVADYLEWLSYSVWTGDELGAGTAWTYYLNGDSVNDNASAHNKDTYWQVLGVSATQAKRQKGRG